MLADYHLHCEFSDDSDEPMEDQVKQGIKIGLDEMCFTDHVDYGIKRDWTDGAMQWREGADEFTGEIKRSALNNVNYPEYFSKLMRMQKTYGDQITIKKGLEFGIQTGTIAQYEQLYDTWRDELDFTLLSMHQVDNKEFWNQDFQTGKTQEEYNMRYWEEILAVQQQFKHYSVLAHLDLLARYDQCGPYPFEKERDLYAEILRQAIADGKGIEMNTSSWHYGLSDTTPSRDILRLYKDLGGTIVSMGSDAHSTKYLGDHMKDAQDILKNEIGIDAICTFDKMVPTFHKI